MPPLLIAITCDRRDAGPAPALSPAVGTAPPSRVRPPRAQVFLNEVLVARVRAAGGIPVLLPPGGGDEVDAILAMARGVIITGGAMDIHPRHYGQDVVARLDRVEEARTTLELPLARACAERGVPLLGICGGMQALAVALGGTLVQDIRTLVPGALEHEQPTDPATPGHLLEATGPWAALVGTAVNSTHHQAVAEPGPLDVFARAPDGVIEAVALPGHPFCLGVQWHPELLDGRLFAALVSSCG
ncbi:MAG: gamma-glutamyl-gamma-aminobutyrate hydrolase family protein [Myxococcota bacterium]